MIISHSDFSRVKLALLHNVKFGFNDIRTDQSV